MYLTLHSFSLKLCSATIEEGSAVRGEEQNERGEVLVCSCLVEKVEGRGEILVCRSGGEEERP